MDQLENWFKKLYDTQEDLIKKITKLMPNPIKGRLGLMDFKETYQLIFCKTLVKIFDSPLSKTQDWKNTSRWRPIQLKILKAQFTGSDITKIIDNFDMEIDPNQKFKVKIC